jgi:hypothetical protein
MKNHDKQDQRLMATWAADCVERVLPFFEKAYPKDDRSRKAIEACRTWVRTFVIGSSGANPAQVKSIVGQPQIIRR